MSTWEERFRRREPAPPQMELVETCWRMKAVHSGKTLACGIYRTEFGLEARAGYVPDDLLQSRLVQELDQARTVALDWRRAVLAKGSFAELPPDHGTVQTTG